MRRYVVLIEVLACGALCAAQTASPRRPGGASLACPPSGKAIEEVELVSSPDNLQSLILGSHLIVRGTVSKVLPAFNRNPNISTAIETDSVVSVTDTLYGTLPGTSSITLAQMGGKTSACEEVVPDDPLVRQGEEYILFLRTDHRTLPNASGFQRYAVFGMWNGKAKVENQTVHFLPSAERLLHKYDGTDVTAFVENIRQLIGPLGLKASGGRVNER